VSATQHPSSAPVVPVADARPAAADAPAVDDPEAAL